MFKNMGNFFKRKNVVISLATILSTIFIIDLIFYDEFNVSAFGGALCFVAILDSIIHNQKVKVSNQ
jgi:hypothetical protein